MAENNANALSVNQFVGVVECLWSSLSSLNLCIEDAWMKEVLSSVVREVTQDGGWREISTMESGFPFVFDGTSQQSLSAFKISTITPPSLKRWGVVCMALNVLRNSHSAPVPPNETAVAAKRAVGSITRELSELVIAKLRDPSLLKKDVFPGGLISMLQLFSHFLECTEQREMLIAAGCGRTKLYLSTRQFMDRCMAPAARTVIEEGMKIRSLHRQIVDLDAIALSLFRSSAFRNLVSPDRHDLMRQLCDLLLIKAGSETKVSPIHLEPSMVRRLLFLAGVRANLEIQREVRGSDDVENIENLVSVRHLAGALHDFCLLPGDRKLGYYPEVVGTFLGEVLEKP